MLVVRRATLRPPIKLNTPSISYVNVKTGQPTTKRVGNVADDKIAKFYSLEHQRDRELLNRAFSWVPHHIEDEKLSFIDQLNSHGGVR